HRLRGRDQTGELARPPERSDEPGAGGPQLQQEDVLAVDDQRALTGHPVEQPPRPRVARLAAVHADQQEGSVDGERGRQWVIEVMELRWHRASVELRL